jgi:hypothetical protein
MALLRPEAAKDGRERAIGVLTELFQELFHPPRVQANVESRHDQTCSHR